MPFEKDAFLGTSSLSALASSIVCRSRRQAVEQLQDPSRMLPMRIVPLPVDAQLRQPFPFFFRRKKIFM
jgi:hypothetical protein